MNYDNISALIGLVSLVAAFFALRALYPKEENEEERLSKVQQMTFDAFFLALFILMTFVPNVGFIVVGPVTLTLLHLPVLLGAALFGWKRGAMYGFMFGMLSWIKALVGANNLLDIAFQQFSIAVLPRLVFGLISGIAFSFIRKLHKEGAKSIYLAAGSFFLTILHTVLVFLVLGFSVPWVQGWLFSSDPVIEGTSITMLLFLSFGMLGEATLGAILTPLLYKALTSAIPALKKRTLAQSNAH